MRIAQIVIIDQDPRARAELQKMLALSGFAVVGETGYGIQATSLVLDLNPDVVMVRVEEPVARCLQAVESIVQAVPRTPVVAFSSLADTASIRRAMLSGVRDYLSLPLKQDEMARSVHAVLARTEARRQRGPGGREYAGAGTVLTVFGAKGGIGKTTIATNLAVAIRSRTDESVALMDMDTRFGDVAIMMDLPPEGGLGELVRDGAPIDAEAIRRAMVRHPSGVSILPAPRDPSEWQAVEPRHIREIVAELAKRFDYVVLDTPGTFNDLVEESLRVATLVLLVTSMDMASIKDTVLTLEMLHSWGFPEEKLKVAVNHTNHANGIKERDLKRTLDLDIFWRIPYDRTVSSATQAGEPIVRARPRSRVSRSISGLAETLAGARGGGPGVTRHGLFHRGARWAP